MPNNITIDDMDRFEKNRNKKKIRPIKNTWYDCLINYIPEPIRKIVSALKDEIASLCMSIMLEQTVPEQTVYGRGQKLSKPKNELLKSLFYWKKTEKKLKAK